ncbi:MAG: Methyltransferase type 11 [Microgenomates group bacterium GW2011_GWC2_45_8]|nr:MAG: Methyltransferase type 11 [Microgenomates group bacterium GW2011_GWC2_45_8]
MQKGRVREGYNKMARRYLAERGRLKTDKYIHKLLKYLPKNATILDLGCGAGVPIDDILLKAGHHVVGIDISSEQIKLARTNCLAGEYLVRDVSELKPREYLVQAVISFYTIFHIPRTQQADLLQVIASYLPSGGMLLITMGDREFEGEHILMGEPMWVSQWGTAKNHKLVEEAGYRIILDEIDESGGERHQVILGKKK